MALVYDLETDIRYLQGMEAQTVLMTKSLLRSNYFSQKQIADILEVSLEFVEKIVKEVEKK